MAACRGFAADIAQQSEASTHSSEVHSPWLLPSAALCWHAMNRAWSTMELQQPRAFCVFVALQAGEHGSQRRSRSAWILAIPCIAAAGLGTWQVQRRSWKMDLIEQRAAALQASPAARGLQGGCAVSVRAVVLWCWPWRLHLCPNLAGMAM